MSVPVFTIYLKVRPPVVHFSPYAKMQTEEVGASWRTRYDDLRLNTPGWMSTQPSYRASRRRYGEFPSRDAWVRYLEDNAAHHCIDVRFGTQVRRLEPVDGGWRVETDGENLQARFVVIATGFDRVPHLPDWPGREGFSGKLIHSSGYRNPEPYRRRDVLVVGPNTTGSEVATLLTRGGAERVRVACRTPPNLITRKFLGASTNIPGLVFNHLPARVADQISWLGQRMVFGNLDRYGLSRSPEGVATTMRRRRLAPAYVASCPSSRPNGSRSSPLSSDSTARMCRSPTERGSSRRS